MARLKPGGLTAARRPSFKETRTGVVSIEAPAMNTPTADWQKRRAQELLDMAARLNAKTYVWRICSGTAEDFRAINSQLEQWKPRTRGPSTGKYDPGWGAIDLYLLAYECADKLTPAARAKIFEVLEEYSKPGEYAYETEPRRIPLIACGTVCPTCTSTRTGPLCFFIPP